MHKTHVKTLMGGNQSNAKDDQDDDSIFEEVLELSPEKKRELYDSTDSEISVLAFGDDEDDDDDEDYDKDNYKDNYKDNDKDNDGDGANPIVKNYSKHKKHKKHSEHHVKGVEHAISSTYNLKRNKSKSRSKLGKVGAGDEDGEDGKDGEDGEDGEGGKDGKDGELYKNVGFKSTDTCSCCTNYNSQPSTSCKIKKFCTTSEINRFFDPCCPSNYQKYSACQPICECSNQEAYTCPCGCHEDEYNSSVSDAEKNPPDDDQQAQNVCGPYECTCGCHSSKDDPDKSNLKLKDGTNISQVPQEECQDMQNANYKCPCRRSQGDDFDSPAATVESKRNQNRGASEGLDKGTDLVKLQCYHGSGSKNKSILNIGSEKKPLACPETEYTYPKNNYCTCNEYQEAENDIMEQPSVMDQRFGSVPEAARFFEQKQSEGENTYYNNRCQHACRHRYEY